MCWRDDARVISRLLTRHCGATPWRQVFQLGLIYLRVQLQLIRDPIISKRDVASNPYSLLSTLRVATKLQTSLPLWHPSRLFGIRQHTRTAIQIELTTKRGWFSDYDYVWLCFLTLSFKLSPVNVQHVVHLHFTASIQSFLLSWLRQVDCSYSPCSLA